MKKIGIFCLGTRRVEFIVAHAHALSKCKYDDYHFYLLGNEIPDPIRDVIKQILGDKVSIYQFDPRNNYNYMMKIEDSILPHIENVKTHIT
jgi:hypothetical protein